MAEKKKTALDIHIESCMAACNALSKEMETIVVPSTNLDAIEAICRARRAMVTTRAWLVEAGIYVAVQGGASARGDRGKAPARRTPQKGPSHEQPRAKLGKPFGATNPA
jgi:hypothetical protein